jgi:hypothetical protein
MLSAGTYCTCRLKVTYREWMKNYLPPLYDYCVICLYTYIPHAGVKYVLDEAALNRNILITVSSFWPNYNHHTRLHLTSCDRLYNHDVTTNVGLAQYQLLPLRTIKAHILVMLSICWNNYWDGPGENQITLSLWFKYTHGGSENVRVWTKQHFTERLAAQIKV